jgi:hypothetical protein
VVERRRVLLYVWARGVHGRRTMTDVAGNSTGVGGMPGHHHSGRC